jgi:hypothetical protein
VLTRSLDEIIRAITCLPDHLVTARRHYSHNPQAMQALRRLQDALMEVDSALLDSTTKLPGPTGASRRGVVRR